MKNAMLEQKEDFVTRQYASLIAEGMSAEAARARLGEVLGAPALKFLETGTAEEEAGEASMSSRLAQAAADSGGSIADTRAAFLQSVSEARLFALDWWRPIRTFLLYILFLLGCAAALVILFCTQVLPKFQAFDHNLNVHGQGTASWILSDGVMRLAGPLIVIAILLAVLVAVWFWMRFRIARLRPFAGMRRVPWLYGRGGSSYRTLLCLEYASVLHTGRTPETSVLAAALRLLRWPDGKPFRSRKVDLGEQLEQARRLGTFTDELDWQRRLAWSLAQSQLEMSRDRLTLFSRVIFYLLIGYMVVVLYLPIFTIGNMFGFHL